MGESKASILIADDNGSLCKTMSFILQRRGYRAVAVEDGAEAVKKFRERPFDVVFLDVKMLPMDGVETCRQIRRISPNTAVIMMTAYSVEDMVREALQEGAYGVIYKPLEMDKVIGLVAAISDESRGTA